MEVGKPRHAPKRRRFRSPLFLAGAFLAVTLLIAHACANGVWRAVAGAQAPSLLGLVSRASIAALNYASTLDCDGAPHQRGGVPVIRFSAMSGSIHDCRIAGVTMQVNSYLNFLPAEYGGSRHNSGASTVSARQSLDTLEQVALHQ